MYVDGEGERAIREKLGTAGAEGIHFLDNGNYHYVTRFFLERVVSPFSLLVFDNHTDDQEPAFEGVRSCGSWIRDAKEEMGDRLKNVLLVRGTDRISGELSEDIPVYISIDLDVLSEEELKVNWDQGSMHLEELEGLLKQLTRGKKILGIDICGGCLPEETKYLEDNTRVFQSLYEFIEDELCGEV